MSTTTATTTTTTPTSPPGLRNPARRTITNKIFKDSVTFEKYSCETGGAYTRVRVSLGPGGGIPLHYHTTYSETFTPVDGPLGVICGAETLHLAAGESTTVPAGTNHRFFNDGEEEVAFTCELRPGSEGFEKGLYVLYGLANDGFTTPDGLPRDKVMLSLTTVLGDMNFPGWAMMVANWGIRAVAGYGRWMGVEERLLKTYWYS